MRFYSVFVAALLLSTVSCQTVKPTRTASLAKPDSVRYLGSSDELPGDGTAGSISRDYHGGNPVDSSGRVLKDTRSTGVSFIRESMYNIFVRPIRRLGQNEDEHCTRNWIGLKVSDIVDGVPAPAERVRQIRLLGEAAGSVDAQRAENYIAALTTIIRSDSDAICRAEATKSVGKYKLDSAAYALGLALNDKDKYVRIAACEAWKVFYNPKQGANGLNSLLLSENDKDVSIAAIHALAVCGEASSNVALNRMLETADPALQVSAMNSLGAIHHSPCRDVSQWRQFCRGEISVPGEQRNKTSIADSLKIWK